MYKTVKKNTLLIMGLLLLASFQLGASNAAFLKYAVITDFTNNDIEQLKQEYKQVLKNNKPGDVHKWQSDETKNGGEITVIKQYRQDDKVCKRLMFKNHSAKQSATSYFNFCLIDQLWQLSS